MNKACVNLLKGHKSTAEMDKNDVEVSHVTVNADGRWNRTLFSPKNCPWPMIPSSKGRAEFALLRSTWKRRMGCETDMLWSTDNTQEGTLQLPRRTNMRLGVCTPS